MSLRHSMSCLTLLNETTGRMVRQMVPGMFSETSLDIPIGNGAAVLPLSPKPGSVKEPLLAPSVVVFCAEHVLAAGEVR